MFLGTFLRNKSLTGFVTNGLVQLASLRERHDVLVREMLRRGFRHASPLRPGRRLPAIGLVDSANSRRELRRRCVRCRRLQKQV